MNIAFTENGWADLEHWRTTNLTKVKRIMALIQDIQRDPFTGTGKPERLNHFPGVVLSRRIDQEHRLVYVVSDDRTVVIQQARYHY